MRGKEDEINDRKHIVHTLRIIGLNLMQPRKDLAVAQQNVCEKCGLGHNKKAAQPVNGIHSVEANTLAIGYADLDAGWIAGVQKEIIQVLSDDGREVASHRGFDVARVLVEKMHTAGSCR